MAYADYTWGVTCGRKVLSASRRVCPSYGVTPSLPATANIGPTDDHRISHLREFHLALGEERIPPKHLSMFVKYLLLIFPSSTLFNSDNPSANKCHHEFRLKLQDGAGLETLEYHEDDAKLGLLSTTSDVN
ncbi:hypothetical protein A0H81_06358 [Grifola frondosa]|uniref:Uncharacterized protein n=1 Tax=Grifola frondosa TaxID=5627 RepID=A0A1C7MAI4_GRIFR|nr:hypothetical protein A0H81_06358 [Grifola frondosa]